ncbi:MAG: carbohydrate deacetylase [Firmicutes bacterium]|nr:carbohydrate deacetylase [Bacillota bacterium]
MKKIIIHADDFNLSPGVSNGIIKAFQEGIVKSTSVMVNLEGFENSVRLLKQNPGLDAGIHINITVGRPVLNCRDVPTLCTDEEIFQRGVEKLLTSANMSDIQKEAEAQIALAKSAGLKLTHIDSHHYLHDYDEVTGIFSRIAEKEGLCLRATSEDMKKSIRRFKVKTPDFFFGEFFQENSKFETLEWIFETAAESVNEVCCHPGLVDERLRNISSYVERREEELAILTSPEVKELVKSSGIALISYRDL